MSDGADAPLDDDALDEAAWPGITSIPNVARTGTRPAPIASNLHIKKTSSAVARDRANRCMALRGHAALKEDVLAIVIALLHAIVLPVMLAGILTTLTAVFSSCFIRAIEARGASG